MIFELKKSKDKEIKKMYSKAIKDLNEFFEINWLYNTPPLILVKTRKDINNLVGYKTPNWWVGWADDERKIYLLDKENLEKESCHKYSEKDFRQRIKHELGHQFFSLISKSKFSVNQFIWLNEGLAIFVSGQLREKEIPKKFEKFLSQYSKWDGKSYGEAGYAIKLLVEKFGKEKLIGLIKSLKKIKSQKDFNLLFKKIYDKNPTYNFFNKLLEENS